MRKRACYSPACADPPRGKADRRRRTVTAPGSARGDAAALARRFLGARGALRGRRRALLRPFRGRIAGRLRRQAIETPLKIVPLTGVVARQHGLGEGFVAGTSEGGHGADLGA